jgi:hypothetical protein
VGGPKPRTDEICACRCAKRHKHHHVARMQAA